MNHLLSEMLLLFRENFSCLSLCVSHTTPEGDNVGVQKKSQVKNDDHSSKDAHFLSLYMYKSMYIT